MQLRLGDVRLVVSVGVLVFYGCGSAATGSIVQNYKLRMRYVYDF